MTNITKLIKTIPTIEGSIKVDKDLIESLNNDYQGLKWIKPSSGIYLRDKVAIASLSPLMSCIVTLEKSISSMFGDRLNFALETDLVSLEVPIKFEFETTTLPDLISLKSMLKQYDSIARAYPTAREISVSLGLGKINSGKDYEIRSTRALVVADGKIQAKYLLSVVSEWIGKPLNIFQAITLTSPSEFSMIQDEFDVMAIVRLADDAVRDHLKIAA